ncbi:MAG: DNA-protecting protein DprA [Candidatus Omnitrophica bacterium]|nr:DNA-protecting protein DprA [Candidatus Omnitrophota bacterium]
MDNQDALIWLNLADPGPLAAKRLLQVLGSAEAVLRASAETLQRAGRMKAASAQRVAEACRNKERLYREQALIRKTGVTVVTLDDAGYPSRLKTITDPPMVLYVRGTLLPEDGAAIAIVGAREASLYGQETAERFAHDLAQRGVTIVSGLARGIDAAAHRGALTAGGRTIGVLGSGLARLYPEEHRDLAKRIAEQGAVLSEFPLEAGPRREYFPRRNRVISGLSLGVVVVEAGQKSGALITADCALEQGREVFAVPGKVDAVTARGTNNLIKQGAKLVESAEDILEEFGIEAEQTRKADHENTKGHETTKLAELTEAQSKIVEVLSGEPRYLDEITRSAELPVYQVSSELVDLEMRHLVKQLPGKRYVRVTSDE